MAGAPACCSAGLFVALKYFHKPSAFARDSMHAHYVWMELPFRLLPHSSVSPATRTLLSSQPCSRLLTPACFDPSACWFLCRFGDGAAEASIVDAKKRRDNDPALHTGQQVFSCCSFESKPRSSASGGCKEDHDHDHPRVLEPWECTDGVCVCVYVIFLYCDSSVHERTGAAASVECRRREPARAISLA
jgi:hypothetical protein